MSKFYFILLVNIIIYVTATAGRPEGRSSGEKSRPNDVSLHSIRKREVGTSKDKQMQLAEKFKNEAENQHFLSDRDITILNGHIKKKSLTKIIDFIFRRGNICQEELRNVFNEYRTNTPSIKGMNLIEMLNDSNMRTGFKYYLKDSPRLKDLELWEKIHEFLSNDGADLSMQFSFPLNV